MAGAQERILRRRIKSVESTKKITRAMELIAASRIVKAQERVHAAVPYSDEITKVVRNLAAASSGLENAYLTPRPEIRRVAQVVIAGDRGLAGAYNANVIRAAEGEIREHREQGRDNALVTVGRKVESYFRFRDFRIERTYGGFSDLPSYENAREVAIAVNDLFLPGHVDRVDLVYTRFVSAGFQEIVVRPLIPLEAEVVAGEDQVVTPDERRSVAAYEFEPSPEVILARLLPRYVEARIYAALLNAAASEHAARQRAMKAATDNAEELIITLNRQMNRARQDAITTEIMEIVGGSEALRAGAEEHEEEPALVDVGEAEYFSHGGT